MFSCPVDAILLRFLLARVFSHGSSRRSNCPGRGRVVAVAEAGSARGRVVGGAGGRGRGHGSGAGADAAAGAGRNRCSQHKKASLEPKTPPRSRPGPVC